MNMVEVALNGPCCSGCLALRGAGAWRIFAYDEDAHVAVILKNSLRRGLGSQGRVLLSGRLHRDY